MPRDAFDQESSRRGSSEPRATSQMSRSPAATAMRRPGDDLGAGQTGGAGARDHRGGVLADRDQPGQPLGRLGPQLAVTGLRVGPQLSHVAEHREGVPLAGGGHDGGQRRAHRGGVRVVAVIEDGAPPCR